MMKFLAALASVTATLAAATETSNVDSFIEAELPSSAAPGVSYAIVDGETSSAKGFGEAKLASGNAVTADTRFPIGSVTKSFTALAIMQLVEGKALDLDAAVSTYLTAFADGPGGDITIRQLLNHTSGFSTVQGNSLHGESAAVTLTLAQNASRLGAVVPDNSPGSLWEYSNTNYQILGAVIEQVTTDSYPDYIAANILKPLGMTNTSAAGGDDTTDIITGHRPWFGGVRAAGSGTHEPIHAPAGGIVASANDMAKYLAMWVNGQDDVLSAKAKREMMQPSGPMSPLYGLGWFIDAERGTVYHTGLVPGAETLMSFDPDDRKGVVVMVNANGGLGFSDTWYLIGGISARALGQSHDDDGSRVGPQAAYLSIAILPPLFVIFAVFSWRNRAKLRAKKASRLGLIGLWFPLLAMCGLAWFLINILPRLFGGSIAMLQLYQPDFALCMIAAAILSVAWAILRLALACLSKPSTAEIAT